MSYDNQIKPQLGLGFMNSKNNNIQELINVAMENNIKYFEVATFYLENKCQQLVSGALSKYNRSDYFLGNKLCLNLLPTITYNQLENYFNDQLKACKVDYFDVYLLQALNRYSLDILLNNKIIFTFLDNMKLAGKIKKVGFSFHDDVIILNKILELYNWDTCQIQLSIYDWYFNNGKSLYFKLKELNIPIIIMKPGHGSNFINQQLLKKHSIYEYNLIFLQQLSNVKLILTGANTKDQILENINCLNNNYYFYSSDRDLLINNYKNNLINLTAISKKCTCCTYCEQVCTKQLKISKIFEALNNNNKEKLLIIRNSKNSWYKCIGCKKCEQICPQQIPITNILKNQLNNLL